MNLTHHDYQAANAATEQIHLAAQFLAMAGKSFLPHQKDDSHTNLGWNSQHKILCSHPLNPTFPIQLCLSPSKLQLLLVRAPSDVLEIIDLKGKKQTQIIDWIKRSLEKYDLDSSNYTMDLHYELPAYGQDAQKEYSFEPQNGFQAFSTLRHWSDLTLQIYPKYFEHASSIRTWPHHFDHGLYCPLVFENEQAKKSVSIGFAIHDETIPEHYLYITHWDSEGNYLRDRLKSLPFGYWNEKNFFGAVLPISEILDIELSKEREKATHSFIITALQYSIEMLELPPIKF